MRYQSGLLVLSVWLLGACSQGGSQLSPKAQPSGASDPGAASVGANASDGSATHGAEVGPQQSYELPNSTVQVGADGVISEETSGASTRSATHRSTARRWRRLMSVASSRW